MAESKLWLSVLHMYESPLAIFCLTRAIGHKQITHELHTVSYSGVTLKLEQGWSALTVNVYLRCLLDLSRRDEATFLKQSIRPVSLFVVERNLIRGQNV